MLTRVIHSYVGHELVLGKITIKPWGQVEVAQETIDPLTWSEVQSARQRRDIAVCLMVDGLPVAGYNEAEVLERYAPSTKA